MFDKRLFTLVPQAKTYIIKDVAFQWMALIANIIIFLIIGSFLQQLLDESVETSNILKLLAVIVVALILRGACQTCATRCGQKASQEAKSTVRQKVYEKLVKLGPSYRESISTGKALQISVEGVEHLESYFGLYVPQLFYSILAPLTLFICLAPLSLPVSLALLVCVPLIPLSIIAVQKIAKRVMNGYWGSYTDLGTMFLESIQGLTTLKVFQADESRHQKLNEEAETFRKATMRLLVMQLNSITVMDFFAYGGSAVGIIVALFQMSAGALPFGAVFTIVFLSADFFLPLRALGSYFHTAMSGLAAADTMFELLNAEEPPHGTRRIDAQNVTLTCEDVSYAYDNERIVLKDINLTIPQGSFIGITGESGSGKSTLAGIITGSLARYTGNVLVNGIDLKDINAESLRQAITYVPFSSYLFEGTVRSNLLLGNPKASDSDLINALERCRLLSFVQASGGLDAPIAPEGLNLSGGQRQRLAMARALLHDSAIYVLDEATSNIDAESEAAIIALAQELATDKTVIMITHRLAALKEADAIVVLNSGVQDGYGNHITLLSSSSTYQQLWNQQKELEAFSHNVLKEQTVVEHTENVALSETIATTSKASAMDTFGIHSDTASAKRNQNRSTKSNKTSTPCENSQKTLSHTTVMARLIKLVSPLLPVMILAIVLGVAGFFAAIFLTVFAAYGMLEISNGFTQAQWLWVALAIGICALIRGPLRYGEQICNHYLAFRILALVRDKLFGVMRKLAPAKLEEHNKGDLVSMVTSDVELLEVFYAQTISPVVISVIVSLGVVIFIGFQSILLAVLALIAFISVGVIIPLAGSKVSDKLGRDVRDRIGAMNTFVLESLRGISEILQFGGNELRSEQLKDNSATLIQFEDSLKKRSAAFQSAIGQVVMIWDIVMVIAASLLVLSGQLEFSAAVLSIAALMSSFGPVIAVANLGTNLQQTLASGERVLELLDETPVVNETDGGVALESFDGAQVRNASFSYEDDLILHDIDIDIEPDSVVLITGKSGAGKSTLLKLLMRFWDVENGKVIISSEDIKNVDSRNLRDMQGFMSQDTFLFDGTIRDNLLIAKPNATERELIDALDKASLTPFIQRLSQGIDTPVGDLGDSLSGGERQRLGLARVFLHDAPFMLLDEPTSNLDSLNEAAILQALVNNHQGKTVVLVSHRSSAAAIADKAYSVEQLSRAS